MTTNGQKLLLAAPTLVIAESVAAVAHTGGIGAIVALGAAGLAYVYADELNAALRRGDSPVGSATLNEPGKHLKKVGYRLLVGKSSRQDQDA